MQAKFKKLVNTNAATAKSIFKQLAKTSEGRSLQRRLARQAPDHFKTLLKK